MDPRRGARAAADHDLTPRRTSPPSFQEISFVVTDSNPGLDPSETTSEEDYDGPSTPPDAIPTIVHHRPSTPPTAKPGGTSHLDLRKGGLPLLKTGPVAAARHRPGGFVVTTTAADALAVHEAVRHGLLERAAVTAAAKGGRRRRGKFSDLVFTRTFSAFDRQNPEANSIFHGFFTLFWMAVFLFVVRVGAQNYQRHGNPLGTNEVMRTMFRKDVLVLLVADGVMCAVTGVGWVLQRMVRRGLVDWDRTGWVLQNIWQSVFIAAVIGLTMLRDWPWTHTVFFVMHGLTMLMKMHSFAFYNGYLSSAYKKRSQLLAKLKELEHISPIHSPSTTEPPVSAISTSHLAAPPSAHEYKELRRSMPYMKVPDIDKIATAISSGELLDGDQVDVFERMLKWEVDALTDELKGKSTAAAHAYPNNLTLANHYEFIVLPTLVYELEYPRSESISLSYAAEKAAACFGVIFVMILISQTYIYPVVMETVRMKDEGVPIATRFQYFPWMLSDLIFPFMLEYLLAWYLIWETILNFTAEMTYFADRNFYDAWWNSVSWDQFARDWNRPVHNFLLRHVYHSSISAMRVDKHTATLLTFLLSACVHELVMWCIFKKLRGYLLFLQMCQLPLVGLSRTKWLRNRSTVGNMFFWFGIFTGPSLLCSLYLIL